MSVGSTVGFLVQLTQISCGECGGVYAISERYRLQKQEQSGFWNCPYCKVSWGYGESENAKLKKQLAQEKHKAEQTQERLRQEVARAQNRADIADRGRAAFKGQVTRIKNRVGKGVCPCCNRSFQNLHRHMTTQHPDWAPDAETEPEAATV